MLTLDRDRTNIIAHRMMSDKVFLNLSQPSRWVSVSVWHVHAHPKWSPQSTTSHQKYTHPHTGLKNYNCCTLPYVRDTRDNRRVPCSFQRQGVRAHNRRHTILGPSALITEWLECCEFVIHCERIGAFNSICICVGVLGALSAAKRLVVEPKVVHNNAIVRVCERAVRFRQIRLYLGVCVCVCGL